LHLPFPHIRRLSSIFQDGQHLCAETYWAIFIAEIKLIQWLHYQYQNIERLKQTLCFIYAVAATAFYKEQSVLDFMKEVLKSVIQEPLQDLVRRQFAKEIKGN